MVQCKTCDNDFECLSCKGPPQFNYSSVKQCDTCPAIHSEIKFVNDFDELAIALNGYN